MSNKDPFGLNRGAQEFKSMMQMSMERAEKAESQRDRLREALDAICSIDDKMEGGDWDEIEEAREIARDALAETEEDGE